MREQAEAISGTRSIPEFAPGDTVTVPVPVAEDNSFVLPRDARALGDDHRGLRRL